jgi:hypothetical protein
LVWMWMHGQPVRVCACVCVCVLPVQEAADAADDDRADLFRGATKEPEDEFDAKRATNDELLKRGRKTAKDTTAQLKQGLADLRAAEEVGLACLRGAFAGDLVRVLQGGPRGGRHPLAVPRPS